MTPARLIGGAALASLTLFGLGCGSGADEPPTIAFSDETTTSSTSPTTTDGGATTSSSTEAPPATATDPGADDMFQLDVSEVDVFQVEVGDCTDDVADGEVVAVATVPCDQAHRYEVFYAFDLPDGDFPGDDVVTVDSEEGCYEQFEPFVGAAYEDSIYGFTSLTPTEESWTDLGDREVLCLIGNYDDTPKTGSARGAGI